MNQGGRKANGKKAHKRTYYSSHGLPAEQGLGLDQYPYGDHPGQANYQNEFQGFF
jgi:hypothetical protein